MDDCSPNPCQNGGTCFDGVNSYNCSCVAGYSGTNCHKDINDCASSPCKNDGNCTDLVNGYNCSCLRPYNGTNCDQNPSDCAAILKAGVKTNGVYFIDPDGNGAMNVSCDMLTDGGGWTVIQRRKDGSVNFNVNWTDYKKGFGSPTGEIWLGNDNIHRLTASGNTELRVEIETYENITSYATFSSFIVADESKEYQLTWAFYNGTKEDRLITKHHNGMNFSTPDQDNDITNLGNCAAYNEGGWWFNDCIGSNLNGIYGDKDGMGSTKGIYWKVYEYNHDSLLKRTEMKIRQTNL